MVHKVGVIYMDLYKVFDSLNHKLLIIKLKRNGLSQHAVELEFNTLGDWRKIIAGVLGNLYWVI